MESGSVGKDRLEGATASAADRTTTATTAVGSTAAAADSTAATAVGSTTAATKGLLDGRAGSKATGSTEAANRSRLVSKGLILLGLIGARAGDAAEVGLLLELGRVKTTRCNAAPGALHHRQSLNDPLKGLHQLGAVRGESGRCNLLEVDAGVKRTLRGEQVVNRDAAAKVDCHFRFSPLS